MFNTSTPFNLSEEAFLLNSIKEVIKVWSHHGQASFNLSVKDGNTDLRLGFQLGLPGDHHLPANQQRDKEHQQPPRYKSPAKKEKDKARAANHQALLVKQNVPLLKNLADSAAQETKSFPSQATIAASAYKSLLTPPATPVQPFQHLPYLQPQ